jgi:hypothetical protein
MATALLNNGSVNKTQQDRRFPMESNNRGCVFRGVSAKELP